MIKTYDMKHLKIIKSDKTNLMKKKNTSKSSLAKIKSASIQRYKYDSTYINQ